VGALRSQRGEPWTQLPSRSPIGSPHRARASHRLGTLRQRSSPGSPYVRCNDCVRRELFEVVRSDFVARFVEVPDASGSKIVWPAIGVGERHMSARCCGPRLGRERLRNDGSRCKPVRGENSCATRISAASPRLHEPLFLTTDQKVGGSSPSGRALRPLPRRSFCHL